MQVSAADAKKFSQVWTHSGIAIPMNDTHFRFAADFANIVLKSFIEQAQQRAAAAAKNAKPKVTLT